MTTARALVAALVAGCAIASLACADDGGDGHAAASTRDASAPATITETSVAPATQPAGAIRTLTAQGNVRVEGLRGERYCEVLLARIIDGHLVADVWNSYGLGDCPQAAWSALDASAIKTEHGALVALLNGPRYWLMDAIERKPPFDRREADFGAIRMFLAATVDLGPPPPDLAPYTQRNVARNSVFEFREGSEIYELTDPAGRVYVMQAYSVQNDASLTELDLPKLGGIIRPPAGWSYQARVLHETLRVESATADSAVVQDELGNTYSLAGAP